jgi:hypothetical protein
VIDIERMAHEAGIDLGCDVCCEPPHVYKRAALARLVRAVLEEASKVCESSDPYRSVIFYDGVLKPSAHEGRLRADRVRALMPVEAL